MMNPNKGLNVVEESRLSVLDRQILSLRREIRELTEWKDIMESSLLKRLWWWASGWRFRHLGRWR